MHDKREIDGTITVTLAAEDWVWLCELLSEVVTQPDLDEMCRQDIESAISTLQSFEAGV